MNSYDSKHLRVLNLISAHRWAEISPDDMHELRILIACKYVVLKQRLDKAPSITLNPEGRDYHQSLSQRAKASDLLMSQGLMEQLSHEEIHAVAE